MTPEGFAKVFSLHKSVRGVQRATGISYGSVHRVYVEAVNKGLVEREAMGRKPANGKHSVGCSGKGGSGEASNRPKDPKPEGRIKVLKHTDFDLPADGKIKRYFFTSAQNATKIHKPFWENLLALADHYTAEVFVSRFTYAKSGFGADGDKASYIKRETNPDEEGKRKDAWWAKELNDHFLDDQVNVAPGLVFNGRMNILPTAARPLSGFETFNGRKSGIFPHVKLAMQSIPSGKHEPTKFNYTTGTVTQRNYIQKKAGLKGEFHHCYSALLVEVDSRGNWWVRQINADSTGTIYDKTLCARGGEVTDGHRVEAITWGDIHVRQMDPMVRRLGFAEGGMLDTLKPKHQFFHDVLDFRARSHHDMKDPFRLYERWLHNEEDVHAEVKETAHFLASESYRSWCKNVVVDSNHHNHLGRWLKEQDARWDPINVDFWLAMNKVVYDTLRAKRVPNFLRLACNVIGDWNYKGDGWKNIQRFQFLDEDEGYVICDDAGGGIQCGQHGDLGPNGSRGSPLTLARMGRKANTGHTHSAGIFDGVYVSGTSSILDPDWVKGPSSWSHSHTVTYPNGKRAIYTMWADSWAAGHTVPSN